MKSIKQQYIDLKEGRMSQHNFMRSVRMSLPQYITNVTSFNDTVKILKNKGILNEVNDRAFDVAKKLKDNYQMDEEGVYVYLVDDMGLDNMTAQSVVDKVFNKDNDEDAELEDMIAKAEDELSPEMYKNQDFPGGISEAKKKKEKKELNPNQIHPQELRMGIKVEMEHTDNLDKAKKIALDHLAENPFYYTALKLAGVESPSAPKAKVPVAFKKEVAAETELVDKINAMKPVKGFEKAKASSNKASKETNSVIKGVEELTHNAKSVRGLQKFAATGGKMKTIKLKEDYESFLSQKRGEEAAAKEIMQATNADGVKFSVNDMAVAPDGKKIKITGFTTGKDGKMKAMYSAGMFADVYNLDDLEKKPSFRPGVDLGKSFDKFKSTLESIVREVIDEMYDGRDDMNAKNEY
jgi:hypothetical protein